MKLFHGSKEIVQKPIFGFGNRHNDYGLGFYCTEDIELAFEWAVSASKDGYVNEYEIDLKGLKVLRLDESSISVLHWLTILLENRVFTTNYPLAREAKDYLLKYFSINYRDYDIIIGYRADDSYFAFANDFISGAISYQQLSKAMKLGNLGKQVVLISKEAFSRIKFIDSKFADREEYFDRKCSRDETARNEYLYNRHTKRTKGDLYINQILDEEIKPNDPRL